MAKKREGYEELVTKLEDIIERMENGELTLDDSIKAYEEGIKTCNSLYKILNDAEGKIKVLNEGLEIDFKEEENI